MIVVIGNLAGGVDDTGAVRPAGFVAAVAMTAAKSGSDVQVVSRIGDDPAGDEVLLGLAAVGVGHVASLRDPAGTTAVTQDDDAENPAAAEEAAPSVVPDVLTLEAADVGLALRYLSDYRVIVVAHAADPRVVQEAGSAATWAGAHLVVVDSRKESLDDTEVPNEALVLSALPEAEGLAARLGTYAATVDSGGDPHRAYAVLTETTT